MSNSGDQVGTESLAPGAAPSPGPSRFGRLSGAMLYFAPTAANGVVALISIPILVMTIGSRAWAEIAVGQSVGSIGMAVVSWGWAISGPALVGLTPRDRRAREYVLSFLARSALAAPVLAACFGALMLLGSGTPLALLSAAGTALLGLSSAWFFIGSAEPVLLLVCEAGPKLLLMLVGLAAAALTREAWLYPTSQIFSVVVAAAISWIVVARHQRIGAVRPGHVWRSLRAQSGGTLAFLAGATLFNAPLALVNYFVPVLSVPFAVVDKVQKLAATAVSPFAHVVLAEVSTRLADGRLHDENVARFGVRHTLRIAAVLAVPVTVGTVIVLPIVSGGEVPGDWLIAAVVGVWVAVAFVTNSLPAISLAPLGRAGSAVWANLIGLALLVLGVWSVSALETELPTLLALALALGVAVGASAVTLVLQVWLSRVASPRNRISTEDGVSV